MSDGKLTPWEVRCLEYVAGFRGGRQADDPSLHDLMVLGGELYDRRARERRLNSILKLEHFKLIRERNDRLPNGCSITRFHITQNGEFHAVGKHPSVGRPGAPTGDPTDVSLERHEQTALPLGDDPQSRRAGSRRKGAYDLD